MTQHLPLIALWVFFVFGQLLYMLKRAYYAVSAKENPVNSYGSFFAKFWIVLLIRAAAGAVIFWTFASYPDAFTKAAQLFGLTWNLNVPLIPPLAFFAGLGIDVLLDLATAKSKWIQKLIPKGPDTPDGNE